MSGFDGKFKHFVYMFSNQTFLKFCPCHFFPSNPFHLQKNLVFNSTGAHILIETGRKVKPPMIHTSLSVGPGLKLPNWPQIDPPARHLSLSDQTALAPPLPQFPLSTPVGQGLSFLCVISQTPTQLGSPGASGIQGRNGDLLPHGKYITNDSGQ